MLSKMLVGCLATLLLLSHSVLGGDEVEKVDFWEINATLDSKRFKPVWDSLLQGLEFEDLNAGRIVVSEFPSTQMDLFSVEIAKPSSYPRTLLVCDFSNDFVEMRFRKDWYKPKRKFSNSAESEEATTTKRIEDRLANSEKVVPSSIPNVKMVALFLLEQNKELELLSKNVFRQDFSGTYTTKNGTYIANSTRRSESWPSEIDTRMIGWCRLGQIALPTTSSEWLRILKTFEHYSIEMIDDAKARLVCVERNAELKPEKCWLFDVELDSKQKVKLRAVTTYIAIRDAGQSILCRAKPEFTSRFQYENDRLDVIVTNDVSRGVGHRFDFEVETRNLPDEDHFRVLGLGSNSSIVFDPAMESALKNSIQLGIDSK